MSILQLPRINKHSYINVFEKTPSKTFSVPSNNYSRFVQQQAEQLEKIFNKKPVNYEVIDNTFGLSASGTKKIKAVDTLNKRVLQEIEFTHANSINYDMDKSFPRLPKNYFDDKGVIKKLTIINKLETNDKNRKATLKMINYAVQDSLKTGNEGRVIAQVELSSKNKSLIILLKELGFEVSNKEDKKFIDHFYLCNEEKFDGKKLVGIFLPKEKVEHLLSITKTLDASI